MSTNNKITKTDRIILKITQIIALVAIAGLAVYGMILGIEFLRYESTNDAQVEQYVNPINSKVGGYIKTIHFEENQLVKAGDTLITIDNRDYKAVQQEAKASLQSAQSQIDILDANINTLHTNAQVTKVQIEVAKAKLTRQQQEFKRFKNLLEEESTTQQQFDNIKTALDIAVSEYQAAQQAYQAALSKIEDVKAQKLAAISNIKLSEATLDKSNLNLGYTIITAPYTGRIGKKIIQEGQLIQSGQTISYIVNEERGKWIIANFKETQIGKFKIGQSAKITIDAFPDMEFIGEIESISPATGSRYSLLPPDNATGNFVKIIQRIPVRIKLKDNVAKISNLSAGMNANVYIDKP
ncbi:HlyD family secretion protein [Myroides odoratimimus]|uniref:Multidrug transporter n=1 Tax=Myroides odoratimimus TaxID=76832 RepID=A0AAI8C573_9FLAO|nr:MULTISPECIES: HlyD family secretion protein [Myroides]ALU26868.1 multidrug transporter [Myroides odoratimimus]MCA4793242.1 HlyD family secretion protein [Myroides odoratimimus]MCA4820503.1 HlyD family secretion protein [Myroides odoratimimus]MCS7474139.1 HlyD family secretion protein [Myroides odoratimimus]MDM1035968.1 HlyD family secretion protein [Myroides odoratimimus]